MNKLMDYIGPKVNYVLDRWYLVVATLAVLATTACLLQLYGGLIILSALIFSGFYMRWSLQQESQLLNEEEDYLWEDSSKRHA